MRSWWKEERLSARHWRNQRLPIALALLAMTPLLALEGTRRLQGVRRELAGDQRLAVDIIQMILAGVRRTTLDWAHWDYSLSFLAGRNPAFVAEDLGTTSLFDDGGVMVLLDNQGRVRRSQAKGGANLPLHRPLVECVRENQEALVSLTSLRQLACRDRQGEMYLGLVAPVSNNAASAASPGVLAMFTPLHHGYPRSSLNHSLAQLEEALQPSAGGATNLRLNGSPLYGAEAEPLGLRPPQLWSPVLERSLEVGLLLLAGLGGFLVFRLTLLNERRRERLRRHRIERQARHTIRRSLLELDRLVQRLDLPVPAIGGQGPTGDPLAALAERVERMLQACNVLASLDPLTGLPNRRTFLARLTSRLAAAEPSRSPLALLLVDINRFGAINESYGHATGDLTLQTVAARLNGLVGSAGFLARYGGDEFVVLLDGATVADDKALRSRARELAERIRHSFESSAGVQSLGLGVSLSIAISLAEPGERQGEALLQRLGVTMAGAKRQHHLRLSITESAAETPQSGEPGGYPLYNALREAIRLRQLTVVFQPIVDPEGRILAVEALGRWRHPEHGEVPAERFLAVTEQFRLTAEIGGELLRLTLASYAELRRRSPLEIQLCLNVTPSLLSDPGYVAGLRQSLAKYGLSPDQITVEITEGAILEATEVVNGSLAQLRALGVRLSLDDFGTGFSSLSLLSRLQPQEVKIDKSFVGALQSDPYARQIVRLIADMARSMDLEVVAEGIEDDNTFQMLVELGIRRLQGYHFSRPMPLEQLIACQGQTPTGSASARP